MLELKFFFKTTTWATHQPVLYEICNQPDLKILELGCGEFSTGLLSSLQQKNNLKIKTFDTNEKWIRRTKKYGCENHSILHIDDWETFFTEDKFELQTTFWDIVFVDQQPWEARHTAVLKFKNLCQYLILHDCDYFPNNNIFQFADYFSSFKVFMPPEPFPSSTGPPTLLASNFNNCDIEIDTANFEYYLLSEILTQKAIAPTCYLVNNTNN